MKAQAFAKVNLGLAVGGRQSDGYHQIVTLFQSIDLCDQIEAQPADELSLAVEGDAPPGPSNLVLAAAELLARHAGVAPLGRIRLSKGIPAGGGLGGGSSDAAATLVLLDRLWGTRATLTDLHALAFTLGSDVPFFLLGGTALGFGRGEKLMPIPDLPSWPLVLALPGFPVPTAEAYAAFDAEGVRGEVPRADWDYARLWRWDPGAFDCLGNDLEPPVFRRWPRLGEIRERMAGLGAEHARMSGSGSSVFGLFRDPATAASACDALAATGVPARRGRTLGREALALAREP